MRKHIFITLIVSLFWAACELKETDYIKPTPVAAIGTNIFSTQFTANWFKNHGADYYLLDVSTDEKFSNLILGYEGKQLEDTFAIISDLKVHTTYYYRVRFSNDQVLSDPSNVIAIKTGSFQVPVALPAVEVSEIEFTAVWRAVHGTESYLIEFSDNPAFDKRKSTISVESQDTLYKFDELDVFHTYYYRIRAKSGENFSSFSKIISTQTTNLTKPIFTETTEKNLTSFKANWNTVSGATAYVLDVSTDPTFSTYLEGFVGKKVKNLSETITGLNANTQYFFRLRAKHKDWFSEYSDVIQISTLPLEVPVAIRATEQKYSSFTARWETIKDAQSYLVNIYTDSLLKLPVGGYIDFEAIGDSLSITNLQPETKYYYTVSSKGLNSVSEASNTIETQTTNTPAPALRPIENIHEFGFTLNWIGIDGIIHYTVELCDKTDFKTLIDEKGIDATQLEITGLVPDSLYCVRVKASGDNAIYSNIVEVKTKALQRPVALKTKSESNFSFTANWETVKKADAYLIELSLDKSFKDVAVHKNVTSNYHTFEGLTPGQEYFVRVQTETQSHKSKFSDIAVHRTETIDIPVSLVANHVSLTGFTANWQPVDGATGYLVQIASDNTFSKLVVQQEIGKTFFNVEALIPATKYFYRIKAIFGTHSSEFSNVQTPTTLAIEIPVVEAPTKTGLFGFTASWNSIEGATTYEFQLSTDINFTTVVRNLSTAKTFVDFTDLNPLTQYFFRAKAYFGEHSSEYSTPISLTTTGLYAPITLPATAVSFFNFTAKWELVSNATEYMVELSRFPDFNLILNTQTSNLNEVKFKNLIPEETYYYRVKALNNFASSGFSAPITVTMKSISAPIISAPDQIGNFSFAAHWNIVSSANSYEVDLATDANFNNIITVKNTTNNYFKFTDLTPQTHYFYRVRTNKDVHTSINSVSAHAQTLAIPDPVANGATSVNNSSFTANWQAITDASEYYLEVSKVANFATITFSQTTTSLNLNINALTPGTIYYYRVKAKVNGYDSNFSNTISVTASAIEAPVAIQETEVGIFGFKANWNAVSVADQYEIQLSDKSDFSSILIQTLSSTNVHEFKSLPPNTKYYYRIKTLSGSYSSAWSNIIGAWTLKMIAPIAVQETDRKIFSFTASWGLVADATSYTFDLSTDPNFNTFVPGYDSKQVSDNMLSIDDLDFKTTYYYRVRSKWVDSYSDYSNTIAVEATVGNRTQLKRAAAGGSSNFDSNFYYDSEGRMDYFTEVRTSINFHQKVDVTRRATDGTIEEVRLYGSSSLDILDEIWTYTRPTALATEIRVDKADGTFKKWIVITKQADGKVKTLEHFDDLAKTSSTSHHTYFYDANGDIYMIKDAAVQTTSQFKFHKNILNPYAMIEHDLALHVRYLRGTSYAFLPTYAISYEFARVDPLGGENNQSFNYDLNSVNIPTTRLASQTTFYYYDNL